MTVLFFSLLLSPSLSRTLDFFLFFLFRTSLLLRVLHVRITGSREKFWGVAFFIGYLLCFFLGVDDTQELFGAVRRWSY